MATFSVFFYDGSFFQGMVNSQERLEDLFASYSDKEVVLSTTKQSERMKGDIPVFSEYGKKEGKPLQEFMMDNDIVIPQ